jgi:hypothetical protein
MILVRISPHYRATLPTYTVRWIWDLNQCLKVIWITDRNAQVLDGKKEHLQSTSEKRTVFVFQIQFYASPGHLNIGPFEIRTKMSWFWMASLDRLIKKRVIKNLFMTKRSRLAKEKSLVRFLNGQNKMAAIIWQPSCFFTIRNPDFFVYISNGPLA